MMELPRERSLRRFGSSISMTPEVMTAFINILKKAAENCALLHLIKFHEDGKYSVKRDIVIGFQDDCSERSKDVGMTALLMTLSGITNLIQPLAFAI